MTSIFPLLNLLNVRSTIHINMAFSAPFPYFPSNALHIKQRLVVRMEFIQNILSDL